MVFAYNLLGTLEVQVELRTQPTATVLSREPGADKNQRRKDSNWVVACLLYVAGPAIREGSQNLPTRT